MTRGKAATRPPAAETFIARWGEVGRNWGLTPTAGRIHGLLLIAEAPMTGDEITAAAGVARSNVSASLKELRALGLIRTAARDGRKERLEALPDAAEAVANLTIARKTQEVDPAAAALADAAGATKGEARRRLAAYAALAGRVAEMTENLARALQAAPPPEEPEEAAEAEQAHEPAPKPKKKKKKKKKKDRNAL